MKPKTKSRFWKYLKIAGRYDLLKPEAAIYSRVCVLKVPLKIMKVFSDQGRVRNPISPKKRILLFTFIQTLLIIMVTTEKFMFESTHPESLVRFFLFSKYTWTNHTRIRDETEWLNVMMLNITFATPRHFPGRFTRKIRNEQKLRTYCASLEASSNIS